MLGPGSCIQEEFSKGNGFFLPQLQEHRPDPLGQESSPRLPGQKDRKPSFFQVPGQEFCLCGLSGPVNTFQGDKKTLFTLVQTTTTLILFYSTSFRDSTILFLFPLFPNCKRGLYRSPLLLHPPLPGPDPLPARAASRRPPGRPMPTPPWPRLFFPLGSREESPAGRPPPTRRPPCLQPPATGPGRRRRKQPPGEVKAVPRRKKAVAPFFRLLPGRGYPPKPGRL